MTKSCRVAAPFAVFGFIAEDGVVTQAAPIAKYVVGWRLRRAIDYFLGRGWVVEVFE